jgi:hypothetical protein
MEFVSIGRGLFNLAGGLASWLQCDGGGRFRMEFASIRRMSVQSTGPPGLAAVRRRDIAPRRRREEAADRFGRGHIVRVQEAALDQFGRREFLS